MDVKELQSVLTIGETVAVEFKRCGNGIESDTYETVCSFLNRFGGEILMGVLDDGTVEGVPEKAAPDMVKNFIKVIGNPMVFSPTVYLVPEIIKDEAGRTIIHVHVPPSAEVHSYKKVVYDRVDDADVKITSTSQMATMYIRKQNIFTEKKIFPFVTMDDLRLDLIPRIKQMAITHAGGRHPWEDMEAQELLKSAGLYGFDISTGERGYNLAAIMLLGKDDIILNACPAYETDALVRKVNIDRYDDREIVRTNLIESFDLLMDFARKHLPDKFYLENEMNVSLRNILAREMIGNTLMHREFTSTYAAKYVIEKDRMYVENANRASRQGMLTPENLEPNPKNPIISSFFRNIGRADRLGSGVRNLYKYSKYYSGEEPIFMEGDVFRIVVPLNESYSFDFGQNSQIRYSTQNEQSTNDSMMVEESADKVPINSKKMPISADKVPISANKMPINSKKVPISADKISKDDLTTQQKLLLEYLEENEKITSRQAETLLNVKQRRARDILCEMINMGIVERQGIYRGTIYMLRKAENE